MCRGTVLLCVLFPYADYRVTRLLSFPSGVSAHGILKKTHVLSWILCATVQESRPFTCPRDYVGYRSGLNKRRGLK